MKKILGIGLVVIFTFTLVMTTDIHHLLPGTNSYETIDV